ncbi:MAG: hypothetical protein IM559_16910 [Pseudanabaena sp. M151S2SP2A07QC]|nr:hypothetical protein [Pseudanabaena sp. M151S2SP2A07QC]
MKPGKYIATVKQAGMVPDKNMNPQPFIQFTTEEGDITWYGSLKSDKSSEIAVKTAVTAGFTGNDWDDFAKGLTSFDGRKVQIETAHETDLKGKKRLKVKWVNPLSSFNSMSAAEVKAKVSSSALFAEQKQKVGSTKKTEEAPF